MGCDWLIYVKLFFREICSFRKNITIIVWFFG